MKSELISSIDSLWDKGGVIRVIGLAGSGKTYTLAEAMFWAHIEKKVQLKNIVFVSFTRAAIQEIRNKLKMIMQNLQGSGQSKITFVSAQIATLHSWCWHNLLKESTKEIKEAGFYSVDQFALEKRLGEEAIAALSRAIMLDFLGDEDELRSFASSTPNPGALLSHVEEYKETKGNRLDYNDILLLALEAPKTSLEKIDLLLVDESQDLTELQWRIVVRHLHRISRMTVVAGDLTQSIYLWNGAAPEMWLGADVDKELIMNESRRIPADLLPLINLCIPDETKKIACHPTNTKKGIARVCHEDDAYEFLVEKAEKNEEALVLTLSNSNIRNISNQLIRRGILFSRSDSYGKDGFNQIITYDDWYALKLYYSLLHDKPEDNDKYYKSDISKMLKKSRRYSKIWRKKNDIIDGLGGSGEGSQRQFNLKRGDEQMTLSELCASIGLNADNFFEDCFAQKRGDDLYLSKKYYEMVQYYEKCYQGPYMEPKVKLSTVHGAKGLECGCVVLFIFKDKRWPEDERLKLYLNAMCRSGGELIITGEYQRLFYDILDISPGNWMGGSYDLSQVNMASVV